jgi:hypothetical protein
MCLPGEGSIAFHLRPTDCRPRFLDVVRSTLVVSMIRELGKSSWKKQGAFAVFFQAYQGRGIGVSSVGVQVSEYWNIPSQPPTVCSHPATIAFFYCYCSRLLLALTKGGGHSWHWASAAAPGSQNLAGTPSSFFEGGFFR